MLVVANVLFFGWQYWVREPDPPGVTVVDPGRIGETVTLVGEEAPRSADKAVAEDVGASDSDSGVTGAIQTAALDSEAADAIEATARSVTASIGRTCVSVGPFTEVAEAQAELKALKSGNADVEQRAAQGNLFVGHWVYVDNIPTRSAARSLLGKLQNGGIEEAYLIGGNAGEDVISLGIFSSLNGAERIELKAKSIGIEAQMDDRYRQSTVFWLDLRLQDGEQGSALVETYGEDKVVLGDAATCPKGR